MKTENLICVSGPSCKYSGTTNCKLNASNENLDSCNRFTPINPTSKRTKGFNFLLLLKKGTIR